MAVEQIFEESGIILKNIRLGEAEIFQDIPEELLSKIETKLESLGFKILKSQTQQQIERIKTVMIGKISSLDIEENFKLSDFISGNLHKEYSTLSRHFSQHENITIEQYFILQKIEKVKELLAYQENTLTEIAAQLGYKSVPHISSQFKKITGFSPREFSSLKNKTRKKLDSF